MLLEEIMIYLALKFTTHQQNELDHRSFLPSDLSWNSNYCYGKIYLIGGNE